VEVSEDFRDPPPFRWFREEFIIGDRLEEVAVEAVADFPGFDEFWA